MRNRPAVRQSDDERDRSSNSSSSLSTSAAVIVDHVSMVFNAGKSNQVDALVDIDLVDPARRVRVADRAVGCGKSTLLRLIANLIEPTSGTVLVNGKSAKQARLDQDYGMAFQQSGLFEWRTVRKNIELPLELKGWNKAKRQAGATRCSSSCSSPTSPTTCRGSCRAACSSASPSPGRSPRTRRCC